MAFVGGFVGSGAVGLWGILAPLGALVFNGARAGVRWFVAFVAVFLVSGHRGRAGRQRRSTFPAWFASTMIALNVTVAGAVVFGLLAQFVRQREEALAALRVEQDRAESLLLNILPRSIADKLKADTATIADQFAAASILFADVVDFTPLSDRLQPAEVVGILDHLFTHFDLLADRYGVEKIKTIGDCYMVAAGVPTPRADHARVMALMALDMRDAMRSQDAVGHLGLEIRIGINSGPVVAGVIGRKRFLYDLWGDAVNTASRMESQGTPGQIQVTRATYELLKDEFELEPRGTVPIKGKGDVETWYLVGRSDDHEADRIDDADPGRRVPGSRRPRRGPARRVRARRMDGVARRRGDVAVPARWFERADALLLGRKTWEIWETVLAAPRRRRSGLPRHQRPAQVRAVDHAQGPDLAEHPRHRRRRRGGRSASSRRSPGASSRSTAAASCSAGCSSATSSTSSTCGSPRSWSATGFGSSRSMARRTTWSWSSRARCRPA